MAKINWTFKNESGSNLNRYIATNEATGEQIIFKLVRGANISIVGTPLNAENLNSLIEAINDNYNTIVNLKNETKKIYLHTINLKSTNFNVYLKIQSTQLEPYNTNGTASNSLGVYFMNNGNTAITTAYEVSGWSSDGHVVACFQSGSTFNYVYVGLNGVASKSIALTTSNVIITDNVKQIT